MPKIFKSSKNSHLYDPPLTPLERAVYEAKAWAIELDLYKSKLANLTSENQQLTDTNYRLQQTNQDNELKILHFQNRALLAERENVQKTQEISILKSHIYKLVV